LEDEGGTTEEGEPTDEVDPVLDVGGTTDPDDEAVVGLIGRPVKGSIWTPLLGLVARPVEAPLDAPVDDPATEDAPDDDPVLEVGGTTDPVDEAVDEAAEMGRPVAGLNASPVAGLIGKPVKGSTWGTDPEEEATEGTPFELPKDDPVLEPEAEPPAGKVDTEEMGTLSGGFPALTLLLTLLSTTGGATELEDDPGVKVGDARVVVLAEKLTAVVPTTGGMTTAVAEAPELEFAFSKASASSGVSKTVYLLTLRSTFSSMVVAGSRFT